MGSNNSSSTTVSAPTVSAPTVSATTVSAPSNSEESELQELSGKLNKVGKYLTNIDTKDLDKIALKMESYGMGQREIDITISELESKNLDEIRQRGKELATVDLTKFGVESKLEEFTGPHVQKVGNLSYHITITPVDNSVYESRGAIPKTEKRDVFVESLNATLSVKPWPKIGQDAWTKMSEIKAKIDDFHKE